MKPQDRINLLKFLSVLGPLITLWLLSKPSSNFSVIHTLCRRSELDNPLFGVTGTSVKLLALPHPYRSGRLDFELLSLFQNLKGSDFKIHDLSLLLE